MRFMTRILLTAVSILPLSGCGPSVDLVTGLRVEGVSTGWLEGGASGGLNKLVPTVSFSLTNVSGEPLPLLQVNAVFRRAGEAAEWGARFAAAADPKGLQPGASTRVLMLSSDLGYTGADPRDVMLRNSRFVDADVDLFAKYRSTQWVRLGRFPVQRQLLVSLRQ
jgi:hypothetical protein